MTARRTSPRALYAALEEGDVSVLFANAEPRLIGRTEDGQEVWEIEGRFVLTEAGKENGCEADDTVYRLPFTKSALLAWRWEDDSSFKEVLAGFGPRLATLTQEYDAPREPGVKYLHDVPTYELGA